MGGGDPLQAVLFDLDGRWPTRPTCTPSAGGWRCASTAMTHRWRGCTALSAWAVPVPRRGPRSCRRARTGRRRHGTAEPTRTSPPGTTSCSRPGTTGSCHCLGARDLLVGVGTPVWCRDTGLVVVVASSANQDDLQAQLDVLDAHDLVQATTTAQDAERTKPEPDILEAALHPARCRPGEGGLRGGRDLGRRGCDPDRYAVHRPGVRWHQPRRAGPRRRRGGLARPGRPARPCRRVDPARSTSRGVEARPGAAS